MTTVINKTNYSSCILAVEADLLNVNGVFAKTDVAGRESFGPVSRTSNLSHLPRSCISCLTISQSTAASSRRHSAKPLQGNCRGGRWACTPIYTLISSQRTSTLNEGMHKAQDRDSVSTTSSCLFCLGRLLLVHFSSTHSTGWKWPLPKIITKTELLTSTKFNILASLLARKALKSKLSQKSAFIKSPKFRVGALYCWEPILIQIEKNN